MPRKDRRFTASDVARLYCRNLTLPHQLLARAIFDDCGADSTPDDKQVARIIELLAQVLSEVGVPLVPLALSILAETVENADPARIQEIIDAVGLEGPPSA